MDRFGAFWNGDGSVNCLLLIDFETEARVCAAER